MDDIAVLTRLEGESGCLDGRIGKITSRKPAQFAFCNRVILGGQIVEILASLQITKRFLGRIFIIEQNLFYVNLFGGGGNGSGDLVAHVSGSHLAAQIGPECRICISVGRLPGRQRVGTPDLGSQAINAAL